MKTVAIVGFSDVTLPYLLDSKADEIWTVNHAYVLGDKIPRIDRCFELHKKDWFLRKELPGAAEYWEWLTKPHTFPIYLQHKHKEIPSSVKYPRKEVVADLFGTFYRGDKTIEYFTSSVAFMIGLAIYEKWDRIELYGIEMATDSEYGYQRYGAEFMLGLAIGRKIEVVLHPKSDLCKSHVYGYEGVPNIPRPRTEELLASYIDLGKKHLEQRQHLIQQYNQGETHLRDAVLEESAFGNMYDGAAQVLDWLINESDYYLSRQNLEQQMYKLRLKEDYWKAIVNEKKSAFDITQDLSVWQEYLDARATMYANSGAVQVVNKLISECDLKVVTPELILTIKDK